MNRQNNVQHVKSPPRADRLRFVGQADCEASLSAWNAEAMIEWRQADRERRVAFRRTIATDIAQSIRQPKERICEAK